MNSRKEGTKKTSSISVFLSIVALVISGASWWEAHQARRLNYEASLPELSETTELLNPIEPGKPIKARITITNFGRTTAKGIQPALSYQFGPAANPFDPTLGSKSENPSVNSSDLAPGDHTALITTSNVNLEHDHDVAAVMSGQYRFYLFGRVPYKDVDGGDHEFHFCRFIAAPVEGADPAKPLKCSTFNYSY